MGFPTLCSQIRLRSQVAGGRVPFTAQPAPGNIFGKGFGFLSVSAARIPLAAAVADRGARSLPFLSIYWTRPSQRPRNPEQERDNDAGRIVRRNTREKHCKRVLSSDPVKG